jgi:hypothetical protein
MNYWYSSQPDEIFLDLDSNRATARALSVLRVAIRKRQLPIREVWLYSTPTRGHAHMIIVLREDMPWQTRLAWSLWLGNDRLRAAYVLQRHSVSELRHHDLLISWRRYYRAADAYCHCKQKHKKKHVTDKCPAMEHLLGEHRSADYFSRTGSAPPRKKIRVPWGKVSLMQIRNWSNVYE